MCLCILHEQLMYLGMHRHTHITGNNLIPISVSLLCRYKFGNYYGLTMEGEGRDEYRDQIIVTCDVGVPVHSKIHPPFM